MGEGRGFEISKRQKIVDFEGKKSFWANNGHFWAKFGIRAWYSRKILIFGSEFRHVYVWRGSTSEAADTLENFGYIKIWLRREKKHTLITRGSAIRSVKHPYFSLRGQNAPPALNFFFRWSAAPGLPGRRPLNLAPRS